MANSLAAFTALTRSKTPILAPAASPTFFRRVGGLDSGFGGDDGVGGGENRLGGGAVVVVAACHAGIRMRERDHFPVTGDREWTAAERFLGSKKQSWIWKTEN